jgi:serine/threonine-protein phosphatase 5
MIQWFKDGKALPKRYVWEIVLGAHEQFIKEASLVEVEVGEGMTCDVIGDVHGEHLMVRLLWKSTRLINNIGQYYDVLHLFSLTGQPSEKHCLLMNGDLVDRGSWSIEVILTAFAWKCELRHGLFGLQLTVCTQGYTHRECTLTEAITKPRSKEPAMMFVSSLTGHRMNRTYGFEGEAKHKHGEQSYKLFAHVFTTSE